MLDSTIYGRIELCLNGMWTRVCLKGATDYVVFTKVACRQFGIDERVEGLSGWSIIL